MGLSDLLEAFSSEDMLERFRPSCFGVSRRMWTARDHLSTSDVWVWGYIGMEVKKKRKEGTKRESKSEYKKFLW
jgi:hypothetical protein